MAYNDHENWNKMTVVKTVLGKEVRVDPETGQFAAWVGNQLRRSKSLADIEKKLSGIARPVDALYRIAKWTDGHTAKIVKLAGYEKGRYRSDRGYLEGERTAFVHADLGIVEAIQSLCEEYTEESERHNNALVELRERREAIYERARPVTPDSLRESAKTGVEDEKASS